MRKAPYSGRKLALQLLSLFAAIVIWVFISYTENPQIDTTINTVPVQFSGETYLRQRGLMIINKATVPDASVVVRGRRRDLINVIGNISASVDVSGVNAEGEYKLKPSYDIPSSAVYISKRNTNFVEIEVVEITEKAVDVEIVLENEQRNKSFIIEAVPDIEQVTVKGAKEDIEHIKKARVNVDVSAMVKDNSGKYKLVYTDENGSEVLPVNDLFSEVTEVNVSNKVYDKVSLDVQVQILNTNTDRYSVELLSQSMSTVEAGITGKKGKNVKSVTATFDLSDILDGVSKYSLDLNIPEGIYIPENSRVVEAELKISEIAEKTVVVPITVKNSKGRGYYVSPDTVQVRISGLADKLKSENIQAVLDLDSISGQGTITDAEVKIKSKDEDVRVSQNTAFVTVNIG